MSALPATGRPARLGLRPLVAGLAIVIGFAGLILVGNPMQVAGALRTAAPQILVGVLALTVAYYLLQGARWYFLLRQAGSRLPLRRVLLLNMAGQAMTAVLPLGDLTRAALAGEESGIGFGKAAATVTVQELLFTLTLVLATLPGMLAFHAGAPAAVIALAGIGGALAILVVPDLFRPVHRLLARTPLLNRAAEPVAQLREQTVVLLRQPGTVAWTVLDAARAGIGVLTLWLILRSLGADSIGVQGAAFVLGLSYVGGAISVIPGGVGATEASVVGLLVLQGVEPGTAVAAALLQRLFTTGPSTLLGVAAWWLVRHPFHHQTRRNEMAGNSNILIRLSEYLIGTERQPVPAERELDVRYAQEAERWHLGRAQRRLLQRSEQETPEIAA